MKYCRHLLIGLLALLLGGCGTTVHESLKVQPLAKAQQGKDKTIVILPFADYSYANNLETAYRRNLFVSENLTDQFVRYGFHLPVQEDVFYYLIDQNIINVTAYDNKKAQTLEAELQSDWSDRMKGELQHYINLSQNSSSTSVKASPGTHGLTQQEVVKIGRHFSADYIVRGRIIQYKDRQDPSWNPLKKGIIPFVLGVENRILFGQADSAQYDKVGSMIAGGVDGALIGDASSWPFRENSDQTVSGISQNAGSTIFWGAVGVGLGDMAHHTGKVPQAVVQLRIWIQDAYTGNVVWTNRIDVKVSPESVFADYQYDALFEGATEKAITTLINDFTKTL